MTKFSRSAASTCRTVGTSSTSEMSTVSICGQNGNPRSAITNVLVCRTRAIRFSTLRIENSLSEASYGSSFQLTVRLPALRSLYCCSIQA